MKRIATVICALALCLAGYAQEPEKTTIEISPEVKALKVAAQLAKYGYENYSATALIEAARIFSETKVDELEAEKEVGETHEGSITEKDNKVSYDPKQLIADARKYAGKDKTVLALADQVESRIRTSGTRGAVGGPKGMNDRVYGKSSESYKVKFWANELAEVCVSGDGDTDLDLYVYDENGNLIGKDDDYSDECVVRWYPKWTGTFIIKVVNRGALYNNFAIWTN